jgi:hypothetical protein
MPVHADNNVSFLTFSVLWHIPGWRDVLDLEVPERIRSPQDPAGRAGLLEKALASRWARLVDFSNCTVGDVFSAANEPYRSRRIGDIASERGEDPFTTIVKYRHCRRPQDRTVAAAVRRHRLGLGIAPHGVGGP